MNFWHENAYAEELLDHLPNSFKVGSVFDVLKYGPTLQAVKVLIQSLMLIRGKLLTALLAFMH